MVLTVLQSSFRLVDVIKNKGSMDSAKNFRFVEGEEESSDLSSDLRSDLRPTSDPCEVEEEIEIIAAQKNRERFAIKKTYSVEVSATTFSKVTFSRMTLKNT